MLLVTIFPSKLLFMSIIPRSLLHGLDGVSGKVTFISRLLEYLDLGSDFAAF